MQNSKAIIRNKYLDNGSGILITFVVLFYHLPVYCGLNDSPFFVSLRNVLDFFMAWFFFKSGMLHKKRPIKEELQKCWRRLLLPYLVLNICCSVTHIIFFRGDASVAEIIKVAIYNECEDLCYPLWFCLSLAIVRIVYQTVTNKSKVNKWILACQALLLAFIMYFYSYKVGDDSALKNILPITIPYWFGNVFLGLFFYNMGDLLKDKQFNRYVFVVALFIYVAHLFFSVFLNIWYNLSDSYLLSVLYYVAGIIVFNNVLSQWLNKRIPILTHVGENSMVFYLIHGTFLELLFTIDPLKTTTGWALYISTFFITIIFLTCMDILFRNTKLNLLIRS